MLTEILSFFFFSPEETSLNIAAEQLFFAKLNTHIPQVTGLVSVFLFISKVDL